MSTTEEKPEEDLEEGEVQDDDDDEVAGEDNTNDNDKDGHQDGNQSQNSAGNNNSLALQDDDSSRHDSTTGPYPSSYQRHHQNSNSPYSAYPQNPHMTSLNHQRYPSNHHGPPMNHKVASMYNRGGQGPVGPIPQTKVNIPCRHYSKKRCLWGDACRFEHRDDIEFDSSPGSRSIGVGQPGPLHPPMGPERSYPPYRHQPYPPPQMAYPYDHYHGSTPPPMMPHHSNSHWRPNAYSPHQSYPIPPGSPSHVPPDEHPPRLPPTITPSSASNPPVQGRDQSPGYSSSSTLVYERKQQLAYEVAPWNDRGGPGYQASRYDREPAYPPNNRPLYKNHREPFKRDQPPYGYPNYPYPSYKGIIGSQGSQYNRFAGSSQRPGPSELRTRKRSSKRRRHDEGESSWSDSGSEDSFLGQGGHSKSITKVSKTVSETDDRGTGTPPGEPLPDDKPETIEALKKLKEIEDLIKLKKEEQNS